MAAAWLAALAAGCATPTARRGLVLPPHSKKGLVVVSFRMPFPSMNWEYRGEFDARGFRPVGLIDTSNQFGNEPIRNGENVIVPFLVPEGDYEFFRGSSHDQHATYYVTGRTVLSFHAVAGKAVYIGNLTVRVMGDRVGLEIRDRSAIEVPMLLEAYPNIEDGQVEVHLMEVQEGGS